jgi:hypothetical protein
MDEKFYHVLKLCMNPLGGRESYVGGWRVEMKEVYPAATRLAEN